MLTLVALMLVALVGGAGAFWAYKKYKDKKQDQEFQIEGTIKLTTDQFDLEVFKKMVLADTVLDKVVEKHQLVSVWGVADESAAKEEIKKKFKAFVQGDDLKVRYQDKDQDLAAEILKSMLSQYRESYPPGNGSVLPRATH